MTSKYFREISTTGDGGEDTSFKGWGSHVNDYVEQIHALEAQRELLNILAAVELPDPVEIDSNTISWGGWFENSEYFALRDEHFTLLRNTTPEDARLAEIKEKLSTLFSYLLVPFHVWVSRNDADQFDAIVHTGFMGNDTLRFNLPKSADEIEAFQNFVKTALTKYLAKLDELCKQYPETAE